MFNVLNKEKSKKINRISLIFNDLFHFKNSYSMCPFLIKNETFVKIPA